MSTDHAGSLVRNLSMISAVPGTETESVQERISQIQEHDKWKAEVTRPVPVLLIGLAVEQVAHDLLKLRVEVNGTKSWNISRTLKEFKKLVKGMDKAYPIEAGAISSHKRILPNLDFKSSMFIRKPNIKERVEPYLKQLLHLPPYILQSKLVVEFFMSGDEMPAGSSDGSETKNSSSSGSISAPRKKMRLKMYMGEEIGLVHLDCDELKMNSLMAAVSKKFGKAEPGTFVYKDHEGDEITIADDEDLEIACRMYPGLLTIHSISS